MNVFHKKINGKFSRCYYGRWCIAGTVLVRSLRCRTKSVACSEWRRLLAVFESDIFLCGNTGSDVSLISAISDFLSDLRRVGRDDMYIRNMQVYLNVVSGFCRWKLVSDISVSGFIRWRSGSALSVKTLNNYLLGWRSFTAFLVSRGNLRACPFLQVKKCAIVAGDSSRRALNQDEVKRLLSVAPDSRRFIYALAVYTGLRRGEIAGLMWSDFDFTESDPFIRLPAKLAKNRKSAIIPLRSDLRDLLLSARSAGFDRFRFADYRPDYLRASIRLIDDSGRKADFHSLRHSFCTFLSLSGASQRVNQQAMRHSDPKLTANVYTDTALISVRSAVDALPSFM